MHLVSVHVVRPYNSIDTIAAWKKLRFILSVWSDFHITEKNMYVHSIHRIMFFFIIRMQSQLIWKNRFRVNVLKNLSTM